jgi:hypothetical protein
MSPQTALAATLLDPTRPAPGGLRAWNGSDVTPRWAVHRNNAVSGLIDGLACTFPVVQDQVGTEFFRAMAGRFVRQAPPRSPVLAHYGAGLPEFIAGFGPAATLPWLADLAALEWARVQATHAADAQVASREQVAEVLASCTDPGALRLHLHPSVRALASHHAVVSIWAAHQGVLDLAEVDCHQPESALVLRPGLDVLVLAAPPGQQALVQALQCGHALGSAAALAAEAHAAFSLPDALGQLLAHGALTHLETGT